MSAIRAIYHPVNGEATQPAFPASDQHPDAQRYLVGNYYVDAIGGEPTLEAIQAKLGLDGGSMKALVLKEVRDNRTLLFARFDGLQASAIATGNSARATEIEGIKQSLRDMTTAVDLTGTTTLAQMRVAFTLAWRDIAANTPAGLKSAFAGLDQ